MTPPFLPTTAQWIWAPNYSDDADPGRFVLFRRVFELQNAIPQGKVLLYVSADTRYRLYLNGKSISFGPCKSYPGRWNYEEVDIAPWLRQGRNVLAARVLRLSPSQHGCLSMMRTPLPGLIVQATIEGQDISTNDAWRSKIDEATTLIGDKEWDFRLGPCFLGLNEKVDGKKLEAGWLDADYDDSAWKGATIKSYRRKMSPAQEFPRLFPREIPAMTETPREFHRVVKSSSAVSFEQWSQFLSGKSGTIIPAKSNISVDIEAETLTTGFLDLCAMVGNQKEPATLQILYSECYESPMDNGEPRRKRNRVDYEGGQLYGASDWYTLHDGVNHYSPFWFRAFRYIRLTINTGDAPVKLVSLSYRQTHYPLDITAGVSTSSPLFSKLWDISVTTLQNCMHETYEDCPYYEQQQFAMDSRSQILFTYVLSGDDRLARKTMREFHASRRDDGLIEAQWPSPARQTNMPSFSLFWVLMVHDHMVYFGDESLVKDYIGTVDGILNYFDKRLNKSGLVGRFEADCWGFVDWVDGWFTPGHGFLGAAIPKAYYSKGAATFHSLLYAYALLQARELCLFLGRRDTADEYSARHQAIIRAVRTHCLDASTGVFLDGPGATGELSQHTQIFAVLTGCVQGDAAKDLITRTILEPGTMARASFAMSFYAFRAASAAGAYEACWAELIKPWEKMVEQNLTTWAESESMARSDCHGWSATPLYEIATEILGVRQRSDAYVKRLGLGGAGIRIAPRQGLLEDVRGRVCIKASSRGQPGEVVEVAWHRGVKPRILCNAEVDII
ncbi:hypothetical protein jhhlp_005128 [Lomentospora prolificans]|uniref:Alpha-L-rhamnosidase six-hairpin glycosidase domain-containing protein n=1 Tax=Lomentospora prolificans TaxID=41688 RepID=A0A2N3N7P4_9PEZI|nr:hypothetical protein jhhlp_005128 [Lomentospora prolificans]